MNLLRALATISGMTFLSRILGFVRDLVIARAFGAGVATDAFFVAFRLPNLLRRLFAEGAFSQAFVPILSDYKATRSPEDTKSLVDHVASLLGLAVFVVSIIGIFASSIIIYLTAPGFAQEPDKFALTVKLTQITFPYIFFMALVALAGGVLNTWNKFSVPAFTPTLLNISFIVCALFLAPYCDPPIVALAWAVFIGGVLQVAYQVPALKRIGMLPRFSISLKDPGVTRILKLMAPATLGVSVSQISLLLNTVFASYLVHGSVSWLYYADRLMEFPSGVLGVALGTILLPSLSKLHATNQREEFSSLLDWGLRLTLLLTVPAAVGIGVLATPLLSTLFLHGAFKVTDLMQTQSALVAYAVGLVGIIAVKILAPAFYSRQDIRTPVKIALVSLALTQGLNLVFVPWLKHAGLALSISIAASLNAMLLYRGLRRNQTYIPQSNWTRFLLKLIIAVIVMGVVLWFGMGKIEHWLTWSGTLRATYLAALISVGAIVYFATLFVLGFRVSDFKRRAA